MNTWIYSLILIQLVIVSWIDVKTKKISNLWPVVNLGFAFILHMTFRDLYPLSWETLLFPIGFVVVGFFLFLLKIMGAGDSKYLASLFLITPGEFHAIFFEKIVGATIVVGAILLLFRGTQDFQRIKSYALSIYWKGIKETIKSNFSYAPVVLLAWILFGIGKQ